VSLLKLISYNAFVSLCKNSPRLGQVGPNWVNNLRCVFLSSLYLLLVVLCFSL